MCPKGDRRPILFVVCINDLPEVLRSLSFLFAGHLKIVNSSSKAKDLSADLNTAVMWATHWDKAFRWTKWKTRYFVGGRASNVTFEGEPSRHDLKLVQG